MRACPPPPRPRRRAVTHPLRPAAASCVQVGLNAIREICARVPLIFEEEGAEALIQDLVEYKKCAARKSHMRFPCGPPHSTRADRQASCC